MDDVICWHFFNMFLPCRRFSLWAWAPIAKRLEERRLKAAEAAAEEERKKNKKKKSKK